MSSYEVKREGGRWVVMARLLGFTEIHVLGVGHYRLREVAQCTSEESLRAALRLLSMEVTP